MKLFFDGGCRPNPGQMEIAVVARGVVYHQADIGEGSSHRAEWAALLHALEIAEILGERDVLLLGDSKDVINQVNGTSHCKSPEQAKSLEEFAERTRAFSRVRVRHVRRTQNLAGIALERAWRYR